MSSSCLLLPAPPSSAVAERFATALFIRTNVSPDADVAVSLLADVADLDAQHRADPTARPCHDLDRVELVAAFLWGDTYERGNPVTRGGLSRAVSTALGIAAEHAITEAAIQAEADDLAAITAARIAAGDDRLAAAGHLVGVAA